MSPARVVASVRSSTPSCQAACCTEVALAQPAAVWKSAGPDEPVWPSVVCSTVADPRWVVIRNGERWMTTR